MRVTILGSINRYWHFPWALRKFLKEPMTLEKSQLIIKNRLANRENNLLSIVQTNIYNNKTSPYLQLLKCAGCEYGDFEKLVLSDGIETALRNLYQKGVYLRVEEFKGKENVIRGSRTFAFKENDFDNPSITVHFEGRSGGSRSKGTRTVYDFSFLTQNTSVYSITRVDAYEALNIPVVIWMPILPGIGPSKIMTYTKIGKPPVKWFSQTGKGDSRSESTYRMATNYIIYTGRLLGAKFVKPEYVSLENSLQVAQYMAATITRAGGCLLDTYTSSAVRVCQAARDKGIDLKGARFLVGGEPITEAKRKEIEAVGGKCYPNYAMMEAGIIGLGCANAISTDDVHLLEGSIALIQHPREVSHAGVELDAFLLTSLMAASPKILLNVENGDYGTIEKRNCGCKFEKLGMNYHIQNIRSFEKLTAEGMTFIGTEFVKIIEEILPAKFGGSSTDYQMAEEEDKNGITHMSVIVSPDLGDIREEDIIQTILAEIRKPSGRWMASDIWAQAQTFKVKRIHPVATARGKLLPLHIMKRK
jgi:hypothetical protein